MKTILSLVLLLSFFGGRAFAVANKPAKPNILVIYTDDQGYSDLGCMGIKTDVKTPNIDALAKSGVRMTQGYVTAPQCTPSRCGLIIGQYQGRFGMDDNGSWKEVPGLVERFFNLKTLPDRMKAAGYVTGMAGKSHLGSSESGTLTELGFDKVFFKHSDAAGSWNMNLKGEDIPPQEQPKLSGYHLELITDFACAFIERFKSQPFFFYLAYRSPHTPLDAPKKYTNRFPGPMPENRRKALGMIAAVDDGVGKVMETLRENGLEENTLIFVISDNGAPIGLSTPEMRAAGTVDWPGSLNDPLNGGKGMLIEGGIRTPFLMRWKGTIPGGQVYTNPVIALDVAATANHLAGLPDDPALDGVNLLPYLTGQKPGRPHDVLCWRWDGQFAIRQGDMKYIFTGNRQYLFNLAADLEEKHDLLAQQPETARALRAELEKWSQTLIPAGLKQPVRGPSLRYFDFYLDGKTNVAPGAVDVGEDGDTPPKKPSQPKAKAPAKTKTSVE
jgi:arylsulfatase A-like enzyme